MDTAAQTLRRFKQSRITYDVEALPPDIRRALPHLKQAMDLVGAIFLRQQDERLPAHFREVMDGTDEDRKTFYRLFRGPWNPLENYASLWARDLPDRPDGCAFYPEGLTRKSVEAGIRKMDTAGRELAEDHYSVLRLVDGRLTPIPYHKYYDKELAQMAGHLKAAAGIIQDDRLRSYITNRADGLLTGHYRDSEAEWVRLRDVPVDLVIGPFEVYADRLLGIKATYEAFLLAIDHERGERLREVERNLPALAASFPLPAGSRPAVGGMAPMIVAHLLYSAGEAAQAVIASAFNLPNDPWVRGNVGWKQVMIYNVMQAKFRNCACEIARRISGGRIEAEFDPYFYHVVMHEVSHGLGPAYRADGVEVSKSLGSHYTTIEEAKADTGGLAILMRFAGKHGIPAFARQRLLDSYFALLFRSMRFGVHEAHGGANVIQFNWMRERGVIRAGAGGSLSTDVSGFAEAVDTLLQKLCELEAASTPKEARDFLGRYTKAGPEILSALESLSDIPVDIRPEFGL